MSCPGRLRTQGWTVSYSCYLICSLTFRITTAMVVALLCASHNVNVMGAELVAIFQISITYNVVLSVLCYTMPAKVIIRK